MEWEYCILIATTKGHLLSKDFMPKSGDLLLEIKYMGSKGWELVSVLMFEDDHKIKNIQYSFKRRTA